MVNCPDSNPSASFHTVVSDNLPRPRATPAEDGSHGASLEMGYIRLGLRQAGESVSFLN